MHHDYKAGTTLVSFFPQVINVGFSSKNCPLYGWVKLGASYTFKKTFLPVIFGQVKSGYTEPPGQSVSVS